MLYQIGIGLDVLAIGLALLSLYCSDRAAQCVGKRIWNVLF